MSRETRLDTQNADDVCITGGRIDGVAIGARCPAEGSFTQIRIGDYRLFVDPSGGLVVEAPDGSKTAIGEKKAPPGQAKK